MTSRLSCYYESLSLRIKDAKRIAESEPQKHTENQHFINLTTKNAINNSLLRSCTLASVHLFHRERKGLRSRTQTFAVVIKKRINGVWWR